MFIHILTSQAVWDLVDIDAQVNIGQMDRSVKILQNPSTLCTIHCIVSTFSKYVNNKYVCSDPISVDPLVRNQAGRGAAGAPGEPGLALKIPYYDHYCYYYYCYCYI